MLSFFNINLFLDRLYLGIKVKVSIFKEAFNE